MRNCSTSNRALCSTTLSKMSSMTWESIRWPSASTTSCNCIELSIVRDTGQRVFRLYLDRVLQNRYDSAVRRVPAILLLGIFSFVLIVPILAADTDSKLPECCRREGQHRCTMTGAPSTAGNLIQAVCAAYPKTGAAPAYSKVAAASLAQAAAAPILSFSAGRPRIETLAHTSFSRTRQKRGPPALTL